MTSEAAFMAAILGAPDEDQPRLVFADWLEENGQPERAEFIRVQISLARHPPRLVIEEPVAVSTAGPDYFLVPSGARVKGGMMLCTDAKPGCRVDVPKIHGSRRQLLGLRFTKFAGGEGDAVLVRDAESGPDVLGESLRRRQVELFTRNCDRWFPVPPGYGLDWALLLGPRNLLGDSRPGYVVRRGFVDEVRVPTLATWVVEPCEGCGGEWAARIECRACAGRGHTPGIGPAVVRSHPVTRVAVADREPWQNEDGSFSWWMAYAGTSEAPADIPERVWKLLPQVDGFGYGRPARDLALTALSDALILLAHIGDRTPTLNTRHRTWMWVRESGMTAAPKDELPSAVFDRLEVRADCPCHVFGRPGDWRSYATRTAATAALLAAVR